MPKPSGRTTPTSKRASSDDTNGRVTATEPAKPVRIDLSAASNDPKRPASANRAERDRCICVRGAREHNLKNIDVDIPRDQLVVITGLSGSGKSSLAFDTIFAEGQRKYMESLSAYARQFLDQLKKPDVDDIEGLPPTIAIEQRSGVANPRSTVATTTEIYDYLRLLYARCGKPACWAPTKIKKDGSVVERCGRPIQATASTQIVDAVLGGGGGGAEAESGSTRRILVLAPVIRAQKGFHKEVLEDLQKQGWSRVRVNGTPHEIRETLAKGGENPLGLGRYEKHDIDIIVDRLSIRADAVDAEMRQRLAESIESALRAADGTVIVSFEMGETEGSRDQGIKKGAKSPSSGASSSVQTPGPKSEPSSWHDRVFSTKHACAIHPECSLPELSPRLFSFNSHQGACAECHGLGVIMEFDEALCVPDQSRTLAEGAIKPWKVPPPMGRFFRKRLKAFTDATGVSQSIPYSMISEDHRRILMFGATPADAKFFKTRSGKQAGAASFEGVAASLRRWYERSESSFIKEWLGQFMREKTCPTCHGDRLRIEALSVLISSEHHADTAKAFSGAVIPRTTSDGYELNIAELSRLTITDALAFIQRLRLSAEQRVIAEPIVKEVSNRLGFLVSVGLEYLSLDRKTGTLSGGEAQRIRLATQVGSKLVGACYVLDEPTIGLHQRDNARLIKTLRHLADIGNSVLVVEHDEEMIRAADHVLDIGPGPGIHGGRIVAQGAVGELAARAAEHPGSLTCQYLAGVRAIATPRAAQRRKLSDKNAIVIKGARENNLKNIDVAFPLGGLICVTGVSGSGKSTLVNDILLAGLKQHLLGSRDRVGAHARITGVNRIDRVIEVDQSPIGRTPRSNPATYTGIFDDIRKIFAETKEAKIRGYKPGRFSFNVRAQNGGGRCEACEGQGLKKIEMHFLPDVFVNCEVCGGSRFNRETLEVSYRGKNIADVLKLTVEHACDFFENHPKILRFVACLRDVGLGYIELGQPSTTLSGGEAQRVKLATELGKGGGTKNNPVLDPDDAGIADGDIDADRSDADRRDRDVKPAGHKPSSSPTGSYASHTLYVLDEPTTGLHFEDVNKLIAVLNRLASSGGGNTLVVIEHNLDVIKCADWIIDLGPEGGDKGGTIVAQGTPEQVARVGASHTGQYLRGMLGE
ncbi:MAG: excinuclease ABC subunit UvrA [Phycisphaerales bacterium]